MSKIIICVANQTLYFYDGDFCGVSTRRLLRKYRVSTAKKGVGCLSDSEQTPLGHHHVIEKIGGNCLIGTIFKHLRPNGRAKNLQTNSAALMTSRIIRLGGTEQRNKNTESRRIYIHGTSKESKIGTPDSHGCIRMINSDIIELFDLITLDTEVEILERDCGENSLLFVGELYSA